MPKPKSIPRDQLEGAVSVEGNVTPITRQPVETVTPEKWLEMDVAQLHGQRQILVQRYYWAINGGLLEGAKTIKLGVDAIDSLLEEKGDNETGFI